MLNTKMNLDETSMWEHTLFYTA